MKNIDFRAFLPEAQQRALQFICELNDDGLKLEHSPDAQKNRNLAMLALIQNPESLKFIDKSATIIDEKVSGFGEKVLSRDLCLLAASLNGDLTHIPIEFQDIELITWALRADSAKALQTMNFDCLRTEYDLCLMSKDKPQKGKFYVESDGNFLNYKVIDPKGQVQTGKIAKNALGITFNELSKKNLSDVQKVFSNILELTSKAGHTLRTKIPDDYLNEQPILLEPKEIEDIEERINSLLKPALEAALIEKSLPRLETEAKAELEKKLEAKNSPLQKEFQLALQKQFQQCLSPAQLVGDISEETEMFKKRLEEMVKHQFANVLLAEFKKAFETQCKKENKEQLKERFKKLLMREKLNEKQVRRNEYERYVTPVLAMLVAYISSHKEMAGKIPIWLSRTQKFEKLLAENFVEPTTHEERGTITDQNLNDVAKLKQLLRLYPYLLGEILEAKKFVLENDEIARTIFVFLIDGYQETRITNRNLMIKLLQKDGLLIKHIILKFQDLYLVRQALSQNGMALQYVGSALRTKEMQYIACFSNPEAIKFCTPEFQQEIKQNKNFIARDQRLLQFISDDFKKDTQLAVMAIKNNQNAYTFFDNSIWQDLDFIVAIKRSITPELYDEKVKDPLLRLKVEIRTSGLFPGDIEDLCEFLGEPEDLQALFQDEHRRYGELIETIGQSKLSDENKKILLKDGEKCKEVQELFQELLSLPEDVSMSPVMTVSDEYKQKLVREVNEKWKDLIPPSPEDTKKRKEPPARQETPKKSKYDGFVVSAGKTSSPVLPNQDHMEEETPTPREKRSSRNQSPKYTP